MIWQMNSTIFFINIGKTLADKITTRTNIKTYLQNVKTTHQKFKFTAITSEDVFKWLVPLNNQGNKSR